MYSTERFLYMDYPHDKLQSWHHFSNQPKNKKIKIKIKNIPICTIRHIGYNGESNPMLTAHCGWRYAGTFSQPRRHGRLPVSSCFSGSIYSSYISLFSLCSSSSSFFDQIHTYYVQMVSLIALFKESEQYEG